MTTTAKIRAKGLDATGVTEAIAQTMYGTMGNTTLAIVELEHVARHDDSKGDHRVDLTIGLCEPVVDQPEVENALRELTRALYRARRAKDGDALPGVDGDQPTVGDATRDLEARIDPWAEDPAKGDTPAQPEWDGNMDDEVAARRANAARSLGSDE